MTTKAITPYEELRSLVRSDDIQERFREVLGDKSRSYLASLLTLSSSDNLKNCEPKSMLLAAMKAATLDLPIDPNIGHAWIVPYRDGKTGKTLAQFQVGYRGFVQLGLRTHQYKIINVMAIYEGQEVRDDQLTGAIVLNGKRASNIVVGYAAYFRLHDSFEKFLYMDVDQIHAHAKRFSKSYGKDGSPWKSDFDAMAKKTVLKLLLGKYGPLAIDVSRAIVADEEEEPGEGDKQLADLFAAAEEPIEGESHEVTPEQPVSSEPDFITFLVDEKLAIDTNDAETMLIMCKISPLTQETLLPWARIFRSWIDQTGASMMQAAGYANKGEAPK